jgi:hypothetical protein
MIDSEAREIDGLIEYYRLKLLESAGIPSTYFNNKNKNKNRRNKINKIINGIRHTSL